MGKRTFEIINEKGLHARASAKFVELVEQFEAKAYVSRMGNDVSGDSIMGLLMLGASRGTSIDVRTEGVQSEALLDALEGLIASRFGEDM